MRRAVDAERDEALDLTDVERRLPAGLTRDGEPVVLDLDFIDGTKGAHVNISGISGVATKTSYATFLLYSLFNSGVLGAAATNTKGLIFNVKGEDLLFLDHANTRLDDDAAGPLRPARAARPAPFRSVRVLAPPRTRRPERHAGHRRPHDRRAAAVLDDRRVLRAGPAAVPVRRRRGRAPAVHDRRPGGHRPAAPARAAPATPATAPCASTARRCARSATSCASSSRS